MRINRVFMRFKRRSPKNNIKYHLNRDLLLNLLKICFQYSGRFIFNLEYFIKNFQKIYIKLETIGNLDYFYIVGGQKPNTKFINKIIKQI